MMKKATERVIATAGVFLLTALIAVHWARGALNPFSLWNDDLWTAVLIRFSALPDLASIAPPISLGFAVAQKNHAFPGP